VGLTQLAIASWQCPSSIITPEPEFLCQTRNSSCSPGSVLSRHGSLCLLVVLQIEERKHNRNTFTNNKPNRSTQHRVPPWFKEGVWGNT
jgi:hypothetical protein